jgi:hypothetical protein
MSNKTALDEKLLRFAAPALYQQMADIFSSYHIHPYDIHGTVIKKKMDLMSPYGFLNLFHSLLQHR